MKEHLNSPRPPLSELRGDGLASSSAVLVPSLTAGPLASGGGVTGSPGAQRGGDPWGFVLAADACVGAGPGKAGESELCCGPASQVVRQAYSSEDATA